MRAGLLGRRLGHSLSPQIHRIFGDYEYRLYEREDCEAAEFIRDSGLDFLNVTIPYKVLAAETCDELSPLARRLGNANLVIRRPDGKLFGDNTDAFGFRRLLESAGVAVAGRYCSVLGAGGAAMTARTVLEDLGAKAVEFVRRGESPSSDSQVIVNATPVGMYPDSDSVRIDIGGYPNCESVVDLVYNPSPTRLVREARAVGKIAVDGMVMLIAQAWGAVSQVFEGLDRSNIYLYGPPASGKSTLARMVAAASGLSLVDLDDEIVRDAGRAICDIFADAGEATFREMEKAALRRVAGGFGRVVALGGGALIDDESRQLAERTGRVVLIDCSEAELLARSRRSSARPLLAGDAEAKLRRLLAARRAHYASFERRISIP